MDEAEWRGESDGEATVVEGAESESQVVEVIVLRRAGLPLEGTAVEAIVRGWYILLSTGSSWMMLVLLLLLMPVLMLALALSGCGQSRDQEPELD